MFYLVSEEDLKDCMFNYCYLQEDKDLDLIRDDIHPVLHAMIFTFCRFTVSMATPINTANSTPVIEHRDLENQVNWADRELLYLQRGPLMANDSNYRF